MHLLPHQPIVLGLDLGTRKTGLAILQETAPHTWSNHLLMVVPTTKLVPLLRDLIGPHHPDVVRVMVDAPFGLQKVETYRAMDRLFMRGLFNNNHVGLQPNNPGLLNIDIAPLAELLHTWQIRWSNHFDPEPTSQRCIRETFPNLVLGLLFAPDAFRIHRRRLRFQFGRGSNVPVVSTAFDLLDHATRSSHPHQNLPAFFTILTDTSQLTWDWLWSQIHTQKSPPQADDLIAALTCALVGAHEFRSTSGFVRTTLHPEDDPRCGHYALPGPDLIHPAWHIEINELARAPDLIDLLEHSYLPRPD